MMSYLAPDNCAHDDTTRMIGMALPVLLYLYNQIQKAGWYVVNL